MNRRPALALLLASSSILLSCQDAARPLGVEASLSADSSTAAHRNRGRDHRRQYAIGATHRHADFNAHFNARSNADGDNARGSWSYTLRRRGKDLRQSAKVVCLSVDDNRAVIGLRFTHKTNDRAHPPGSYALLVVVDSGKTKYGKKHHKPADRWAMTGAMASVSCDAPVSIALAKWPGGIRVKDARDDGDEDPTLLLVPDDTTLYSSQTLAMTAVLTDDDDELPLPPLTWTSSDAAVATVDAAGLVTAIATGSTTISAASATDTATATIDVITLFCPAGRPEAHLTLQAAITATNPNGTLLVCDGEHEVDGHISRPLTLRSENPGGATLRDTVTAALPGQFSHAALYVDTVAAGLVRIVDIGFSIRGVAVMAEGTFDRVEIDSARFFGRDSVRSFGVFPRSSTVPTAIVEVTNSFFKRVNIGVFPAGILPTNVRRSSFDSSAIAYTHNGVDTYGFGTAEDNTFEDCPRTSGCITIFSPGAVTVARNRIVSTTAGSTLVNSGAIVLNRGGGPFPYQSATIEDNEIVSQATGAPPATAAGWQIFSGINVNLVAGAPANVIRRNRIENAFVGLASVGNAIVQDNVVIGGNLAFQALNSATISATVTRNDFIGQIGSFTGLTAAVGPQDYTCNWWGSAAGPTAPPPAVPVARYTPFSTVPIANTPSVACP